MCEVRSNYKTKSVAIAECLEDDACSLEGEISFNKQAKAAYGKELKEHKKMHEHTFSSKRLEFLLLKPNVKELANIFCLEQSDISEKRLFDSDFYLSEHNNGVWNIISLDKKTYLEELVSGFITKYIAGRAMRMMVSHLFAFPIERAKLKTAKEKIKKDKIAEKILDFMLSADFLQTKYLKGKIKENLTLLVSETVDSLKRIGGEDYEYSIADFMAYASHNAFSIGCRL